MKRYKPYYFERSLVSLKGFHKSMKLLNVEIATFDHQYNGVLSHVILDIRTSPWNLVFIKHIIGDTLTIPIHPGYLFVISGDASYRRFLNYFGIQQSTAGSFHISSFIKDLEPQVPSSYTINHKARCAVYQYTRSSKDDGMYPIGLLNWDVFHAENPQISKDLYHRSDANLMKTKIYILKFTRLLKRWICQLNMASSQPFIPKSYSISFTLIKTECIL